MEILVPSHVGISKSYSTFWWFFLLFTSIRRKYSSNAESITLCFTMAIREMIAFATYVHIRDAALLDLRIVIRAQYVR